MHNVFNKISIPALDIHATERPPGHGCEALPVVESGCPLLLAPFFSCRDLWNFGIDWLPRCNSSP